MRRLLAIAIIIGILPLSGCNLLLEQTDAADEAILRVVAVGYEGEELTLIAATGGEKSGEEQQPVETTTGTGEDYSAAREDMKRQRQAALVHVTDWVVEEKALGEVLNAFIVDPELTYAANLYLLREQTAQEFMDSFSEEKSAARSLGDLDRALKEKAVNALTLSADLAAGRSISVPVLESRDGKLEIVEEVELDEWVR